MRAGGPGRRQADHVRRAAAPGHRGACLRPAERGTGAAGGVGAASPGDRAHAPGVAANLVGLTYIAAGQGRRQEALALAGEATAIAEASGACARFRKHAYTLPQTTACPHRESGRARSAHLRITCITPMRALAHRGIRLSAVLWSSWSSPRPAGLRGRAQTWRVPLAAAAVDTEHDR